MSLLAVFMNGALNETAGDFVDAPFSDIGGDLLHHPIGDQAQSEGLGELGVQPEFIVDGGLVVCARVKD